MTTFFIVKIISAYIEMTSVIDALSLTKKSFPRTCGGDPEEATRVLTEFFFSPHMRG